MSATHVTVLGEALELLLAADGHGIDHARTFTRDVAGAETNVAIGLARLGHPARCLGRVGDDAAGRFVRRRLREEGVDDRALVDDPDRTTGLIQRDQAAVRPISVRYVRHRSAGAAIAPPDLSSWRPEPDELLHVSGITGVLSATAADTVETALRLARSAGARTSFDVNLRVSLAHPDDWRSQLERFRGLIDVLFVSDDELPVLPFDAHDPGAYGVGCVVVKLGAEGACSHTVDGSVRTVAHPTVIVDLVGAGDAFAVGYLDALLRDEPEKVRLAQGAACAACVIARPGDVTGLPDRTQLDALLAGQAVCR